MSILLIKSNPCSLRSGIIAPRGLGCLCGKAVQLSDTFSGHACCDGVPKTLVWERTINNEKNFVLIQFKKKITRENHIYNSLENPVELITFASTWE